MKTFKAERAMLIILDGWGIGDASKADAIFNAHTPYVDSLYGLYPHTKLKTCGEDVGLPDGQMGNSEVGHLNIGAGRVVYQELARINKALENGTLAQNEVLQKAIALAKQNNKPIHLLGLVSDGGVHAHINHLKGLLTILQQEGIAKAFVHAFTDGRDTDPNAGLGYLDRLQAFLQSTPYEIATICGRYFAMDRDKRWERVAKAYHAIVNSVGTPTTNIASSIAAAYAAGTTDEFLEPLIAFKNGEPVARIQTDDVVLFFNFRTDRGRELTQVLTQQAFESFQMKPLNLHFFTLTQYDATFNNVHPILTNNDLSQTLGEVLANEGKTQLRLAETEKYPHVTFFFSGGREDVFKGENRILVDSPKVATYDLQPEMSAIPLTSALLKHLETETPDFVCINYANADMVGHTGVYEAIKKAVETVDRCLSELVPRALAKDYTIIITADHGNADVALNADGSPNTAHSLNEVPCFFLNPTFKPNLKPGRLADLSPTILKMLQIPQPQIMDGEPLY